MKTFSQLREGFVSAAQRKAVWASKADGGKGHPDHKKKKSKKEEVKTEDSDAVKAFLAKGGKIKKLPPAKAQGYHGKDDPGKGMHGMMDKGDTRKIGTRKKVKSMESLWDNIRKRRAAGKPRLKPGQKGYPKTLNVGEDVEEAMKYTHVAVDKKGKVAGMASKASDAKDMARRHGGTHHQLKKPMHPKVGDMMINKSFNPVLKKEGDDHRVHKESSYSKLNKYNKDAQASKDKATNSAVATILRKGDHSKDLNTMRKREKGLKMVKSRITDKIRKGHKANEGTVNELSPDTKKSYTKKATTDLYGRGLRKGMDIERGSSSLGRTKVVDKDNDRKIKNRHAGIYRAQK